MSVYYRAFAVGRRGNPAAWPADEDATRLAIAVALASRIERDGKTWVPSAEVDGDFLFGTLEEAIQAAGASPCKYVFVVSFRCDDQPVALVWGVEEQ